MSSALIATLGTEPQVVTITLALLRQKGFLVSQLYVVHTDGDKEPSHAALARLSQVLQESQWSQVIEYKSVEITHDGQPLADIETEAGARATFRTLFSCAAAIKQSGLSLHMCIAGGRKSMAAFGMATAQLLFDEQDYLWHLVSFGSLLKDKRMFPEHDDQVTLVPIPVIRWSDVPPSLTEVGQLRDPDAAVLAAQQRQAISRQRQIRRFVEQELTPAEREVVVYTIQQGGSYQDVARALGRSPRTIDSQLQTVYRKLEAYFGLEKAQRATMMALLSPYWQGI